MTRYKSRSGFSLIEVMIVVVIMGIVAGMTGYGVRQASVALRIWGEKQKIEKITHEVERSFKMIDFSDNVACIAGYAAEVGGTDSSVVTTFGAPAGATGSWSIPMNHWAGKLSRNRGDLLVGGSGTYTATPNFNAPLYELLTNSFGQPRMLFAGPVTERVQRYIMLSIAARPDRNLVIPAPPANAAAYATWFDAIWSTTWDGDAPVPALWGSLLSPADYANWTNGSEGGRSNAGRLVVGKITQTKFPIVLNNNVANADARVRIDGISAPILEVPGLSNVISTIRVPWGRFAIAESRPTGSTGGWSMVQRQHVTTDTVFTVQISP